MQGNWSKIRILSKTATRYLGIGCYSISHKYLIGPDVTTLLNQLEYVNVNKSSKIISQWLDVQD